MNVAFVGATRGMGRALARRLAERGDALFLLGRDAGEMELSARDLQARGARVPVDHASLDLARPEGFAAALDAADRALAHVDALVVTGGAFGSQDELAQLTAYVTRGEPVEREREQLEKRLEGLKSRLVPGDTGTLAAAHLQDHVTTLANET